MGIRQNTNQEVVEMAHKLLCSLSKKVANDKTIANNWIDRVWEDLKNFLKFLESGLMDTAVGILANLSSADSLISSNLIGKTLPILITSCSNSSDKEELDQIRILSLIQLMLDKACPVNQPITCNEELSNLLTKLYCGDMKKLCLDIAILQRKKLVCAEKENFAANQKIITESFVKEKTFLNPRTKLVLLIEVWKMNQDLVEKTIDKLMQKPDDDWPLYAALMSCISRKHEEVILKHFKQSVFDKHCCEFLKCFHSHTNEHKILNDVLSSEKVLFDSTSNDVSEHIYGGKYNFLELLLNNDADCHLIRRTLRNALLHLQEVKDSEAMHKLVEPYLKLTVEEFRKNQNDGISKEVINCIGPEIISIIQNKSSVIKEILQVMSLDEKNIVSNGQFIGLLLNKIDPNKHVDNYLQSMIDQIKCATSDHFWICKGVLMSGHPKSALLLKRIIENMSETQFKNFSTIFISHRHNYCEFDQVYKPKKLPFWRQKFFAITITLCMDWYRTKKDLNVLELIIFQFPDLAHSVIEISVKPLLPELTQALFSSTGNSPPKMTKAASELLTFLKSVQDKAVLFQSFDVIVDFLLLIPQSNSSDIKGKVVALESLHMICHSDLPKDEKKKVIKTLATFRDHKKRLIREAAVRARNEWMLLI